MLYTKYPNSPINICLEIALTKIQSLGVAVRLEPLQSLFNANARLLMTTKWDIWVHFKMAVNPDSSSLNLLCNVICPLDIL